MKLATIFLMAVIAILPVARGDNATNASSSPAAPSAQAENLAAACVSGNVDRVKALLDAGAPANGVIGAKGETLLIVAASENVVLVKLLIAHGAKLDTVDKSGNTALRTACLHDKPDIALALLHAGANPNLADHSGATSLMDAARFGTSDDLVAALLAHHADPNAGSSSPLSLAVSTGHLGAAKLLIEAGAKVNVKGKAKAAYDSADPLDLADPWLTLVSLAAAAGDPKMIDLLVTHGADINGRSNAGFTPLMISVIGQETDAEKELIAEGADPNLQAGDGETALMLSLSYQPVEDQEFLLDHGAKLEIRDKWKQTALLRACSIDFQPGIRLLVSQGADVNVVDANGETASNNVANRGDQNMVDLLADNGAKQVDFHVIDQTKLMALGHSKPIPTLSRAHSWALAVAASQVLCDGDNVQMLGYGDRDEEATMKQQLDHQWGVNDKAGLLAALHDLATAGDRLRYQAAARRMEEGSDKDVAPAPGESVDEGSKGDRRIALETAYAKWKGRTGLAWDLCRYAYLVNLGFSARFLTEKEAWPLLMANARQVQRSFTSWQEMSQNYLECLDVRPDNEWDTNDASRDNLSNTTALLLAPKDPNSPWNQFRWQTDLSSD